jgi:peptide deformylase
MGIDCMSHQSNVLWPDTVWLGYTPNVSTDSHPTREHAQAVCDAIKRDGLGGEGKIFPLAVWVSCLGYHQPLELVRSNDPILKQPCNPVKQGSDVIPLVNNMFDLISKTNPIGVGLAAPQVGFSERIIVVNYGATRQAIINPRIVKSPGKIVTSVKEGCLSYPGRRVDVKRSKRVIVEGFDTNWKPVKIDARNFLAFIMQHELDHLDGVGII